MTPAIQVPGIPFSLTPSSNASWAVDAGGRVDVTAPPHSDFFNAPGTNGEPAPEPNVSGATLLGTAPDGDFRFHAQVTVDFTSKFDAGVLFVYFDDRHWAKLCFEYSPDGDPMVVSVVTREVSDDANGFIVDGSTIWLRVSRTDGVYAYHASADGLVWRLIRAFALDVPNSTPLVGLEAQSPMGEGCAISFDHVLLDSLRISDIRDGS